MIGQYLSNTNENVTVHILQNFLQVNKASAHVSNICENNKKIAKKIKIWILRIHGILDTYPTRDTPIARFLHVIKIWILRIHGMLNTYPTRDTPIARFLHVSV